jgi:WD40 repeat protein
MSKIIGGQTAFLALRVQYGDLSQGITSFLLFDPVMSMPVPWSVPSRTSNTVYMSEVVEAIRAISVRDNFQLDSLLYYSSSGEYVYFMAIYNELRREFVQFQLGSNTVRVLQFVPRGQAIILEEGNLLFLNIVGESTGSQTSQVALIDLNRGTVRSIYEASSPLSRYVWHSQSQTLVAEFNDIHVDIFASTTPSTVVVFDTTSGEIEHQVTVETPYIEKVLLSSDARFLCLGMLGGAIRNPDGTLTSEDVLVIDLLNGQVDQLTRMLNLDPRNVLHLRLKAFYKDSYDVLVHYADRITADSGLYQIDVENRTVTGGLIFGSHSIGLNDNYVVSPDGEWIAFIQQFSFLIYHIGSQRRVIDTRIQSMQGMEWIGSLE